MNFLNMLLFYEDVVAIFLMTKAKEPPSLRKSHSDWKVWPIYEGVSKTNKFSLNRLRLTTLSWKKKKKLKERATSYSHLVIHYTPMDSTYFSSDVLVLCRLSRMPSLKQIAPVKMTRVRSQSHWIALSTKKCAVYTSKCISLLLYNNPFWKLKLDRDKTSALCNMVIH